MVAGYCSSNIKVPQGSHGSWKYSTVYWSPSSKSMLSLWSPLNHYPLTCLKQDASPRVQGDETKTQPLRRSQRSNFRRPSPKDNFVWCDNLPEIARWSGVESIRVPLYSPCSDVDSNSFFYDPWISTFLWAPGYKQGIHISLFPAFSS